MRRHRLHSIAAILTGLALAACNGGGSGGGDDERDAGPGVSPDADVIIGDAGRGMSGEETDITITGALFVENAPARGSSGEFDPPAGAPVSAGGHVQGGTVAVLDENGDIISESTTDDEGRYAVEAPANGLIFLYASHIEGYTGSIRVEEQRGLDDYEAYDIVLPSISGLQEAFAMSGVTYDGTRGVVAVGINAVDEETGGEGAEVDASHDPAFNLIPGGVAMGNRLAPVCGSDGGPDGCVEERTKQVFFPNVETGRATVTPLDPPAGGNCALRFAVPEWRIEPHTMTVVNVDCTR